MKTQMDCFVRFAPRKRILLWLIDRNSHGISCESTADQESVLDGNPSIQVFLHEVENLT